MGFSCLDCPHHGCDSPFYPAADKQGIGREKLINDFLIKPQTGAARRDYRPPAAIHSPDSCARSRGRLSLCRAGCWRGERSPAGSGMLPGDPGQGPPALAPDRPGTGKGRFCCHQH